MGEGAPGSGSFDIAAVRAMYPALTDGHAYLDGAAGTQVFCAGVRCVGDGVG